MSKTKSTTKSKVKGKTKSKTMYIVGVHELEDKGIMSSKIVYNKTKNEIILFNTEDINNIHKNKEGALILSEVSVMKVTEDVLKFEETKVEEGKEDFNTIYLSTDSIQDLLGLYVTKVGLQEEDDIFILGTIFELKEVEGKEFKDSKVEIDLVSIEELTSEGKLEDLFLGKADGTFSEEYVNKVVEDITKELNSRISYLLDSLQDIYTVIVRSHINLK